MFIIVNTLFFSSIKLLLSIKKNLQVAQGLMPLGSLAALVAAPIFNNYSTIAQKKSELKEPHDRQSSTQRKRHAIICKVGVLISLIDASCVVAVRRQWIICCYIVTRLIICGVLSLELTGFHGSSQDRSQISFLVGGIVGEAFI